jgi:enamine deaminase RidA (YjgF/YER057c/UK114 family)
MWPELATCDAQSVTTPAPIELIRSPELTDDAPYAYAAVAHDVSQLVFTAGACPLDELGATVAVGDATGQAEQVIANLTTALHAAGADLTDVAKTTVYVASQRREDLLAVWEVVRRHFGDHDVPCTLLGVAVLGYPDQLVEVEAVAAIR